MFLPILMTYLIQLSLLLKRAQYFCSKWKTLILAFPYSFKTTAILQNGLSEKAAVFWSHQVS